jgi:hypothetical protein
VVELWADPEVRTTLARLRGDPTREAVVAAVNRVCMQLATDPGDADVRRVRFQVPGLWCVPIRTSDEEWVLLWEPHPDVTNAVAIRYLGPASLA